jgi:hypothetical protein
VNAREIRKMYSEPRNERGHSGQDSGVIPRISKNLRIQVR